MRFPIMLEQTGTGFAVQAADLAIATYGENIEAAKRAGSGAIRIHLEAQSVSNYLENPEFRDLSFAYIGVAEPMLGFISGEYSVKAETAAAHQCRLAP